LRYIKPIGFICLWMAAAALVNPDISADSARDKTLNYLNRKTLAFTQTVIVLSEQISRLDSTNPRTIISAKTALANCRVHYKKISFFLDYFYPQEGKLFNGPAKKELEEPWLESEDPQGLQQIEADLFDPHPVRKKTEMENLMLVMKESASDLLPVYQTVITTTPQLMEALHLELIRIMTLYITGYDAPFLKTGIHEASSSLETMDSVLKLYLSVSNVRGSAPEIDIQNAEHYLKVNKTFNSFNRLIFLTDYALPLEERLEKYIRENGWELNTVKHLNYGGGNLFQKELLPQKNIESAGMITLGKSLFFEQALSGNNSRSCATCHEPSKYFTDQLTRNQSMTGHTYLKRNTPSLFYVAYQQAQFWDGRDSTLTGQIHDVLTDQNEMGSSVFSIEDKISSNANYRKSFHDIFQKENITITDIQSALSAYLESLAPLHSPFDEFMAGNHLAMTPQQQVGFNLFMGKAACGTCHFAPLFNGSTPPFFNRTEYEILGVPQTDEFNKKILDTDQGRYNLYPVDMYRGMFKTPTLRNVAQTHPYMHNGSMTTLHKVLNFYNRGGGLGLGMAVPDQTLLDHPLHLSKTEMNNIIAFLQALTDH
jgi:cytochrome c peroxidase